MSLLLAFEPEASRRREGGGGDRRHVFWLYDEPEEPVEQKRHGRVVRAHMPKSASELAALLKRRAIEADDEDALALLMLTRI